MTANAPTRPSGSDLYVPNFNPADEDDAHVWSVMRLAKSSPHAVWCTACSTWFKYSARSLPSLVRHCATAHFVAADGSVQSKRKQRAPATSPPPPPPSQQQAPAQQAPAQQPRMQPPQPQQPPPPAATAALKQSPSRLSSGSKPANSKSSPNTKPSPADAALAAQNQPAAVRKRGYRVVAVPPAVEAVASRAQELLYRSTGLLFVDVAFQVPRSEEEALAVIRGAVADLDRSSQNGKLFYLSWAHSQFFQAEMAAIGYRFVTARVRNAGADGPPPVDAWLTLRLLTRAAAAAALRKRKLRAPTGQPDAQRRKLDTQSAQTSAAQTSAAQKNAAQKNAAQKNAAQKNAAQKNTAQKNAAQKNAAQINVAQKNAAQKNTAQTQGRTAQAAPPSSTPPPAAPPPNIKQSPQSAQRKRVIDTIDLTL